MLDFQPQRRSRTLRAFGILAVIGYVIWQFISFQLAATQWPATWSIGGEAFKDISLEQALQQVSTDLQQPITLHYYTQTQRLRPASIDFTLDLTATTQTIYELHAQNSVVDFLRRLIFQPPAPQDVPISASYSAEKVRAILAEWSSQLDKPAEPALFKIDATASMTTSGQAGYQLNIIDSMKPIDAALKSVTQREVDLVIDRQPAPPPSFDQLKEFLKDRLAQFSGNASIFVKDLQTG
ncbi:MAG TPA: peptidoglycan binding domain-containing protein, partial [Anaerolineae bacterium]|nr:peptidoglycan binding domain-containing protein [Anaerolineae bacterium]